jgi:predicted amidohydrolase YtcJ
LVRRCAAAGGRWRRSRYSVPSVRFSSARLREMLPAVRCCGCHRRRTWQRVAPVVGAKPAPDYDEQVKRLASLNEHFLERGIVAVNDLLATFVPTPLQMFRDAARAGLLLQCALYYGWTDLQANPVPDLTDEDRTGRMKVAGMKLFMDGAYSNRTAWTNDPYPNSTDHGMRTLADETVREAVGGLGATASRSPSTPWATGP